MSGREVAENFKLEIWLGGEASRADKYLGLASLLRAVAYRLEHFEEFGEPDRGTAIHIFDRDGRDAGNWVIY